MSTVCRKHVESYRTYRKEFVHHVGHLPRIFNIMLQIDNNKSIFYAIKPIIKSYKWISPVQILNMKVFIFLLIFFPLITRVIPGKVLWNFPATSSLTTAQCQLFISQIFEKITRQHTEETSTNYHHWGHKIAVEFHLASAG